MARPAISSVLVPERQPLLAHLGCSVFFHGAALGIFVAFSAVTGNCNPVPSIQPDEAIEVSMVALARSKTALPDRAAVAPRVSGEEPPKVPPPPKPSQESDLVVKTPDAPPDEGNADDSARDEMLKQLKRQQLLESLMGPTGAVDRQATDPNSTSDHAIDLQGSGARGDREYLRYVGQVQKLFMAQFHPLAAITEQNPDLVAAVLVSVDGQTGRVTGYEVTGPSGNAAFDAAAERAVQAVGTLPLPPERFRPLMAGGYEVRFRK